MVALNQLNDNRGARKDRIRVGRGIGSGKGKTCGRGVKGQKSRTGVAIKGFEGGQMPIFRRLPKRGFTNIHRTEYAIINLDDIQSACDAGKLQAGQEVSREHLVGAGLIRASDKFVKLLAKGDIAVKITLHVDKASQKAIELFEKAGGSIKIGQKD